MIIYRECDCGKNGETSNTDYTLDEIEGSCEEGRSCMENGDCVEGQCYSREILTIELFLVPNFAF